MIPADAVKSTVPILLANGNATTIKAAGATGHCAVVFLHLVNEDDATSGESSRVQVLSRGTGDTILGYTYCAKGGGGIACHHGIPDAMEMIVGEAFGLKNVAPAGVISGYAICYVW